MKKIVVVLMLGVMLVLSSCSSSNVYTFIIDESYTESITMGTSADYPPYESPIVIDEEATLQGIDIEIAKHIAKALGKNLQVINRGFDFLLDDLENGKVDFVLAALSPTEERALKVDFSQIYYEAYQVVLLRNEDVTSYDSIESMNISELKIGAQLGSIQQDLLTIYFDQAQHSVIQSINDLVLYLETDNVDGVIMEYPVAQGFAQNNALLGISSFIVGEKEGGSAAAVQKGNTELLNVINEVIYELIETGEMETIIANAILNEEA